VNLRQPNPRTLIYLNAGIGWPVILNLYLPGTQERIAPITHQAQTQGGFMARTTNLFTPTYTKTPSNSYDEASTHHIAQDWWLPEVQHDPAGAAASLTPSMEEDDENIAMSLFTPPYLQSQAVQNTNTRPASRRTRAVGIDHRQGKRVRLLKMATIHWYGGQRAAGLVYNVSADGMFMLSVAGPEIHRCVEIDILLPASYSKVQLSGMVVHRQKHGFGVMFRHLQGPAYDFVSKCLR
jgi:hypothetical protein